MRKRILFSVILNSVLLLALMTFSKSASAQMDFADEKLSAKMTVERDGDEATVILKITMEEHWHINSIVLPEGSFGYASAFELNSSSNFKAVGSVIEPSPITMFDELSGEDVSIHEGTFYLKRKIKILTDKGFVIKGYLDFQTCDENMCLPPFKMDLSAKVKAAEVKTEGLEASFVEINDDEAKDKDGRIYVNVNGEWHIVPEGNSTAFYKKYLTLD